MKPTATGAALSPKRVGEVAVDDKKNEKKAWAREIAMPKWRRSLHRGESQNERLPVADSASPSADSDSSQEGEPRLSATRLYRDRSLTFADLSSRDPAMLRALEDAQIAAKYDIEVLILGETGTGKTLLALAMHNASPRREGPFVHLNVSAVPEHLIESELFGHEKGAFTGAVAERHGVFEAAQGGTLFLDEIGDMSPAMQAKLLTAVEQRAFYAVGGRTERAVDVRFIAATNADLEEDLKDGGFREDLYHRLAKIPIWLPPLRDRRTDILPLALRFLDEANAKLNRSAEGVTLDCEAKLLSYHWPGNIRDLHSRVFRGVALARGPVIGVEHMFPELTRGSAIAPDGGVDERGTLTLAEVERKHIQRVLEINGWNITRAAEVLGLSRQGLHLKMKRCGIQPPRA